MDTHEKNTWQGRMTVNSATVQDSGNDWMIQEEWKEWIVEHYRAVIRIIACAMVLLGTILFIDEIGFWMTGVPTGWLLGDWSSLHIDPFHHWMWGILSFFGGLGILIAGWWLDKDKPL